MTQYDPRQPVPDPGQAVITYLLHAGAKAPTIHFAKERSTPHYRVYGMKYEDVTGRQRYCLCFLTRHEPGLFLVEQLVQRPVEAELYTRSGQIVGTQTVFPVIESRQ